MTQHQHEQEAAEFFLCLREAIAPDYDSLGESTEQL